ELAHSLRAVPHRWLECRSAPEDQNSALHPIVDMMERAFELGDEESSAGKLAKLQKLLGRLDFTLDDNVPVFSKLLAITVNGEGRGHAKNRGPSKLEAAPQSLKVQLLNALLSFCFELSERDPLVLVAEDLQWKDATTLELFSTIVQEASSARIL